MSDDQTLDSNAVAGQGYPRKRARTRNKLIRAAIDCVAQSGPDRLTVAEITGRAEMATGTFYNHFHSLDEIVDAVADQLGAAVEIAQQTLDLLERDPAARVAVGIHQMLRLASDDPASATAFVMLAGVRAGFRARIRAIVRATLAEGSESGRFGVEASSALVNAVVGTALQSMRSRVLGEVDDGEASEVVALVLGMLGLDADEAAKVGAAARGVALSEQA